MSKEGGRGIQSIELGSRLLATLAASARPLMLRELAAGAGIQPAQAHAYMVSYRKMELVEQDAGTGLYTLGSFAMQLGMSRMESDPKLRESARAARDVSQASGLMTTMVAWGCGAPTVIQVQDGAYDVAINLRQGSVLSVTGTVSGRLFAAFADGPEIQSRISRELADAFGPDATAAETTRAIRELQGQVAEARASGFLAGKSVAIPDVGAIAAPVMNDDGSLSHVLTLVGPDSKLNVAAKGPHVRMLLEATSRMNATASMEVKHEMQRNVARLDAQVPSPRRRVRAD